MSIISKKKGPCLECQMGVNGPHESAKNENVSTKNIAKQNHVYTSWGMGYTLYEIMISVQ